jgi:hypothetical protein
MPKFRTDEPPEQSSSGFIGLTIIAGIVMLLAMLFVSGDLTEIHPLQARVFLPDIDKQSSR